MLLLVRYFLLWIFGIINILTLIFVIFSLAVNKHGGFQFDYYQIESVVHRLMRIYDSLGEVLQRESR